ncbi:MAG: histidine phosphatase family protein [Thiotrichaceae bacterium]
MSVTKLIVIRHGETTWNLDGRYQGHADSPLTERGIAQAEAVGKRMKKQPFDVLYSSDLTRAYRTAQCIAIEAGQEIKIDTQLRERNLGIFQGMCKGEFVQQHPEIYAKYQANLLDYVIPQGESFRQCYQRSIQCFEILAQRHTGATVVAVTHGGILANLLKHVLNIPLQAPRNFHVWNASLNIFSYDQHVWTLESWGDRCHEVIFEHEGGADF